MDEEIVYVTINQKGEVEIKIEGHKGYSCLDVTRALEDMLGNDVSSREMTAEAYEDVNQNQQNRIFGD